MTKIKICGIRTPDDIAIVNEFKPDFIGYIFAPTRREITLDTALRLSAQADGALQKVGVFVNRDIEFVAETLLSGAVDLLQLHGQEDSAYEERLFSYLLRHGVNHPESRCIKAYRVRTAADIAAARLTMCGRLLLDAFSEKDLGGTGKRFDWSLIQHIEKPYFLAGGVSADNAPEAIRLLHPYALDVSSSVETDCRKDREKVKRLIEVIRHLRVN